MFDRPNILGSASLTPWQGPPASLGEVFQIDWATTRDQSLSISNTMAREEKYLELSEQAERLFGRRLITPDTSLTIGRSATLDEAEERFFEELREVFGDEPMEFNSPAELNAQIGRERQAQRERQADIAARTPGPGAALTGFAASTLATIADPPIALTSLVGASSSAGILRTALVEAGIAGVTEIPVQVDVQLGRRRFGEDPSVSEGLASVALASGGGFLFGAAFRAAGIGFSNFRELLNKSEQIPNPSNKVKDAQAALRRYVETDEVNPLQRTAQGTDEHIRRLDEALVAVREGRVADLGVPKTPINRTVLRSAPVDRPGDAEIVRLFKAFQRNASEMELIHQRRTATRQVLETIAEDPVTTERVFQALRDAPEPVETLLGFLGRQGIDDADGLLARIGVTPDNAPGVIQEGGLRLNRAIGLAREQGFFPGRARVNRREFLDAVEREIQGDPVVRPEDEINLIDRQVLNDFRQGLRDLGIDIDEVSLDEFSRTLTNSVPQASRPTNAEKATGSAAQVEAQRAQEAVDNIDRTDALTENNFETTFADRLDTETVTITRDDGTEEVITIAELQRRLNQDSEDVAALHICAGV